MRTLHLIVYGLLLCTNSIANAPLRSLFDTFEGKEVLNITLETDFESILNDSKLEDYQAAQLTFKQKGAEEQTWDIKLKQRGKYRRRVCDMPPLKLNFSKKDLANAGLKKFDKMKLVTHCMDDETSRNSVLKEYLSYKLYNELTPNSFRVQLVRITYIDTQKSFRKMRKYGFLIESISELEERLNVKEVEKLNIPIEQVDQDKLALVAEFQYFIGNADWEVPGLRNVKLFQAESKEALITIPYDFDFAGLVSAVYAIPNKNVGQNRVTERVYLGANTAPRQKMKHYFKAKWNSMKQTIHDFNTMNWAMQDEVIAYLSTYFEASAQQNQSTKAKASYGK